MVWAASKGGGSFEVEKETDHQLALRTGISLTVAYTRLHHHSRTFTVDIAHRAPEKLSWLLSAMDCTWCRMGNAEPVRPG
jgi:hypothetical protein